LSRASHDRAAAWFASYLKTVTERDVRDLAAIEGLTEMPGLLRSLARQCGEPLNVSRLSRETGVPHTTLTRYLSLLESVFVLRPLPAWTAKGASTTAKVSFGDPGVLAFLLGADPRSLDEDVARRVLECFVSCELERLGGRFSVMHFRSAKSWSVPVVVVAPDGRVCGVSVSSSAVPGPEEFRGLEFLADVAGERFVRGVLLSPRMSSVAGFTERLSALPLSCLWG
jgi:predicted AAA+ superfamily ATPase